MPLFAQIVIALLALIHVYIFWMESFSWERSGPKAFSTLPRDLFPKTKAMAQNQGVYNGFLAAGLVWSLLISDPTWAVNVALFFLACIAVAGVVGALTVDRKIALIQTVPALVGVGSLLVG
ncbi:DUF1304 domain-containing protein [Lewinella sp. 4G2]|uniref:DUF1304 domain-containing protein n=1 Tax=Lewinella sp. 4G2 TaxID=1803372 RepID=UPI0007B4E928|nr:DUF1304 domain-containing protein [Lewinella sp. 4G2]OAV43258.1 hypothetical protein A3850_001550 [Lewinella sp. 4G2]